MWGTQCSHQGSCEKAGGQLAPYKLQEVLCEEGEQWHMDVGTAYFCSVNSAALAHILGALTPIGSFVPAAEDGDKPSPGATLQVEDLREESLREII